MSEKRYFGTDGIRGSVGESLINPEFVLKLGWAIGRVLANGHRRKVLIGKDTRVSGYMLESALEAGLSAAGVDIDLLGPMPTPAIAYLTRTLRASAGIVISASHNLFQDNGIKFFSADGFKLGDQVEAAIEQELQQPLATVNSSQLGKARRIKDAPGRYIEFCKSTVPGNTRFSNLKIVIDCAHGATYHIAPSVFRELGADVVEYAVQPDGFNINAQCGSTHPEVMQQLVLQHKANLGLAFDGDGDRIIMVDDKGEVLDGDELLYIMARERLSHGLLGGGVVGTLMTNLGLEHAFQQLGVEFARSKVGDRYVLEELLRRNWQMGGEASGHIICLDKTTTGDAIVAALQVLYAMQQQDKPLSELKQGFNKYPQCRINVASQLGEQITQQERVKQAIVDVEHQLNGSGRVLLRASGTEPLIRVMVEGQESSTVDQYAKQLADVVKEVSKQ